MKNFDESHPVLVDLAEKIARELAVLDGNGWKVEKKGMQMYVDLVQDGGLMRLCIECIVDDWYSSAPNLDRLKVWGKYPSDIWGGTIRDSLRFGENLPIITITARRTPHAIARDITNRLLVDVYAWTAKAIMRNAEIQATHLRRKEIQQMICDFAGGNATTTEVERPGDEYSVSNMYVKPNYDDPGWIAYVGWNDTVDMKLEKLTPGLAMEVVALLTKHGQQPLKTPLKTGMAIPAEKPAEG